MKEPAGTTGPYRVFCIRKRPFVSLSDGALPQSLRPNTYKNDTYELEREKTKLRIHDTTMVRKSQEFAQPTFQMSSG
jgi:hypothetical protein